MAERRMGKTELFSHFAEKFDIKRAQAREFFDELQQLSESELKRSGEFVLPGMVKLVRQERQARMIVRRSWSLRQVKAPLSPRQPRGLDEADGGMYATPLAQPREFLEVVEVVHVVGGVRDGRPHLKRVVDHRVGADHVHDALVR